MRSLFALFACLMLVVSAWSSTAQATGPVCSEITDQLSLHMAGDCDEVPADADKGYPHCHTGCHGHHVAAPVPVRAIGTALAGVRTYATAPAPILTAHRIDQTLRPPQT